MSEDSRQERSSPRSGVKLATGLGAGALLLVVVVAGVLLSVRGHGGGGGGSGGGGGVAAPAPPSVTAAPTAVPTAAASTSAGPVDGGVKALATAPTTRWALYQGAALPYSSVYGPRKVDGYGPATGYTHDAGGALFAAAQLNGRVSLGPTGVWSKTVTAQVVPGPARDALAATAKDRNIAPGTVPYAINQIVGYRIATYTPDVALVELVAQIPTGQLQSSTSTMRWMGGDWKLQLTPAHQVGTAPIPVPSLAGYVPWSGV